MRADPGVQDRTEIVDLMKADYRHRLDDLLDSIDNGSKEELLQEIDAAFNDAADLTENELVVTVRNQLGDATTAVRELVQNGKDAYPADAERKGIAFTVYAEDGRTVLEARDYGEGMSWRDVYRDLLVPRNSSKGEGRVTVGEHGVGWFSTLDLADRVQVETNRDGVKTVAEVRPSGTGWEALLETDENGEEGTLVRLISESGDIHRNSIKNTLEKQIGLADPDDIRVTLNGELVNTQREDYERGGAAVLGDGAVELRYKEDGDWYSKALVTQEGFRIGTIRDTDLMLYSILDEKPRRSLFRQVKRELDLWFDLPNDVGLVENRSDVAPRYQEVTENAMRTAFEQFFLQEVLEDDDLMRELDIAFSDIAENWFDTLYREETRKSRWDIPILSQLTRQVAYDPTAEYGADELRQGGSSDSGNGGGGGAAAGERHTSLLDAPAQAYDALRRWVSGDEDLPDDGEAALHALGDRFASQMFGKPILDAELVEDGDVTETTLSVRDLVEAYVNDEIIADYDEGDGVVVDRDHPLADTVLDEMQKREQASRIDRIPYARKIQQSLEDLLSGVRESVSTDERLVLNQTSSSTVYQVVAHEGIGHEYRNLVDTLKYVDDKVSAANDVAASDILLHHNSRPEAGDTVDLAHTDGQDISYNLFGADSLLDALRDGELDQEEFEHLLDTHIHEKAHCVGDYDGKASHGDQFYTTKRRLRQRFAHAYASETDMLDEVNRMLDSVDQPTGVEEFAEHVDQYSGVTGSVRSAIRSAV